MQQQYLQADSRWAIGESRSKFFISSPPFSCYVAQGSLLSCILEISVAELVDCVIILSQELLVR